MDCYVDGAFYGILIWIVWHIILMAFGIFHLMKILLNSLGILFEPGQSLLLYTS
jgi:uncharacterized membrane protein YagU involved in acid resistance